MTQETRLAPPVSAETAPQQRTLWDLLFGWMWRRIGAKIILPHMIIMIILAVQATYVVTQLLAGSLQERLLNQLLDAGRKANDAQVRIEEAHLTAFRAIAFSQGVDTALARGDVNYLRRAILPIQYNFRMPYVEVVDLQGRQILSLQLQDNQITDAPPEPGLGEWEIVQKSLRRDEDPYGDKWSALMPTSHGYTLYIAGPVRDEQNAVTGAVVVGTPVADVIAQLASQTLTAVTLYHPDGSLLATTFPYRVISEGIAVDPQQARDVVTRPELLYARRLAIGERGYDELVGRLEVRKAPAVAMGVAYPSDHIPLMGVVTRSRLLLLLLGATLIMFIIGVIATRHIVRPLRLTTAAWREVAQGKFDVTVPVITQDESGVLAQTFNEMVEKLRERERLKETFGRALDAELAASVARGDIQLAGEEREVTVLRSDLRGFAELSAHRSPVEVVALLNAYFGEQDPAVQRYRGWIDRHWGDATLAVFGAPLPCVDHAERAVLAALAVREALVGLNARRRAEGQPPLQSSIWVHTGRAVMGAVGADGHADYTLIGDVALRTQRVEDVIPVAAWDILITDTTYARVEHFIEVDQPHTIALQGRDTWITMYPVLGIKPGARQVVAELARTLSANGSGHTSARIPTGVS